MVKNEKERIYNMVLITLWIDLYIAVYILVDNGNKMNNKK